MFPSENGWVRFARGKKLNIGDRLREERNRLGLTQQDGAKAAGVGYTTYMAYEAGRSFPNAEALNLLHAVGFDVLYVVTGVRNGSALSNEDSSLLADLNQVDEKGRALVRSLLDTYKRLS
ncbi:helix-turn-helix transcriptional regulator [Chromobacterium sp. IIBBL 290-4]|uniref:helix-turn-helix transcriptional regulator n=1 Tax=Chromobacterium sp. IIBBL 290-4 TaxID=2953890 RepID=UPI0020B8E813|nr:helix-turn-helix transcriptional regulator [Chromobacterium sp. IIBBL 290-4]UTH73324.1 helix-turn-helix domain-containing protein [Chromobacterium sp. IIBBL 290-4]